MFRKISFLQKRWIQVKIFDQYFVFSEVELCRNTWKLENQDYYLYFSDRSSGGKRWLIDHVNWYQDPVKRNGNGNVGYVYALHNSSYPYGGFGQKWKSVYGDDPQLKFRI